MMKKKKRGRGRGENAITGVAGFIVQKRSYICRIDTAICPPTMWTVCSADNRPLCSVPVVNQEEATHFN